MDEQSVFPTPLALDCQGKTEESIVPDSLIQLSLLRNESNIGKNFCWLACCCCSPSPPLFFLLLLLFAFLDLLLFQIFGFTLQADYNLKFRKYIYIFTYTHYVHTVSLHCSYIKRAKSTDEEVFQFSKQLKCSV